MGITRRLKSYFLRGSAILLPTILTIWIFVWGYGFIRDNISVYINRGLVRVIMHLQGDHEGVTREALNKFWVDGTGSLAGFIVAVIAVCIVGALLASVVGRTLWRMIEKFIMNTPFLKRVYPYIKQFTDFFLTQADERLSPSKVVAVEYPRKGVWSIGIVTGGGFKKVAERTGLELLTIFIPNSPTPITGFTVLSPKDQVIELDMTIEEAFRFIASVGVIGPDEKQDMKVLPKAGLESK